MTLPGSARELDDADRELVELARATIDAHTDAGPDEDGVHTMGAAVRAADGRMFAAVGNHGRGPVGPCGRDRQVLFDYFPAVRVLLPTVEGLRSIAIADLLPFGGVWTVDGGTQPYDAG